MFMFFLWLVTTVVGELLRPKQQSNKPTPAGIGDIQVTTAQQGRAVPVAYGMPLLKGANCTWYGDLRVDPITQKVKSGMFSSTKVTTGYKYSMGSQLVFCHGFSPDSVKAGSGISELRIDDKRFTALTNNTSVSSQAYLTGLVSAVLGKGGSITKPVSYTTDTINGDDPTKSFARITISDDNLFGGDQSEGGFSGVVDFNYGQATQDPNDYLQKVFAGGDIPAYRGYAYATLRQCYFGTSSYPKQLSAVVRHYPWFWSIDDHFRNINGDANPISVIVDLMTNKDYGLGYDFSALDLNGTFYSAAFQCGGEGVGVSYVYDTATAASDLISDVLRHVDGVMYIDPNTGTFKVKLARADYIPGNDMPTFDVDNVADLKMTRSSWDDTKNVVQVTYTNRDDAGYAPAVVEIRNQANIDVMGGVRNVDTYQFLGLSNAAAATKVAARVLKTVSTPMARFSLTVNREAFELYIGGLFLLNWAPLGIANMVCRVTTIAYGNLTDPKITIEAVEDIFGMLDSQITAPQGISGWVDPVPTDVPADVADRLVEAPYALAGDESRRVLTLGSRGNSVVQGYNVNQLVNGQYTETNTSMPSTPSGTLTAAVPQVTVADGYQLTVSMPIDAQLLSSVSQAERDAGETLLLVGDELMGYTTVTPNADGTVTISGLLRGIWDTVPAQHAIGDRVWFISAGVGVLRSAPFTADGDVTAQLLPFSARGTRLDDVPPATVTLASRAARPYAPGHVRVNALPAPATTVGSATLTWAHRSKVQQLATGLLVSQDAGSSALEDGTTYLVRVLVNNVLSRMQSGITDSAFEYTPAMRAADGADGSQAVTLELVSVQNGLESAWQITQPFVMTGLGMTLGNSLGGVQT